MKIIGTAGREDIAKVYIALLNNGKTIEFVEALQPPIPREKKWVLIISTLDGCPVKCRICDAGLYYNGKLSKEDMLMQIDYLITQRFPNRRVPVEKFKIQFARVGEPAFNLEVLDVLNELPEKYDAPGLMVCISTIAPEGCDKFFRELLTVKRKFYRGRFQLQFSIHTTDDALRAWLMPIKKWNFSQIAQYGEEFYQDGDRKIALNFAFAQNMPLEPDILLKYFDLNKFVIKLTPVNPTISAISNKIISHITPNKEKYEIIDRLQSVGYQVILSIGELEENRIGSNCGQYITHYLKTKQVIKQGYTYPVLPS